MTREGLALRAVAGGLVVLAGGLAFGTGAVALTMSYGISGYHAEPGGWSIFVGIVLILTGPEIIARDMLGTPPPAR